MHRLVIALVGLAACGRLGFEARPDGEAPCTPAVEVTSLVAGDSFTCATLGDGTLRCWGAGDHGQLGDGTFTSQLAPIEPLGLGAVSAVAASLHHSCAVVGGVVSCWGRNEMGQLGLGDRLVRGVPTTVPGLPPDVVGVAAGGLSSCAWTASGQLWCWGQENGSMTSPLSARLVPGVPAGVTTARQGTAGSRGSATHGCAIAAGTTWCWGANDNGQLGDGTQVRSTTPVQVVTSEVFVELALGGRFSCGRTASGGVWCWGSNSDGQLGDGLLADRLVPVQVAVADVVELAASGESACALLASGEVRCWGDNDDGQLGQPGDDARVPERVDVGPARTIAVGIDHSCALGIDGVVQCWGADRARQRSGSLAPRAALVEGVVGAVGIEAGGDATCVRLPTGAVQCWGDNGSGQLGDGTVLDRSGAVDVLLTEAASDISIGDQHACAVSPSGVTCWGDNETGAVAWPPSGIVLSPSPIPGLGIVAASVSVGGRFTCATPANGIPWCWGANYEGQLGRPSPDVVMPPDASRFPAVLRASGGDEHTCAVTSAGQLFCSGRDNEGQIGRSDNMGDVYNPLEVLLAPMVAAFAAADTHSCATSTSLDRTWCWGANNSGQLGDGTRTNHTDPLPVAVSGVVELVADQEHTCARDGTNRVWCWGANASGQLGDGTLASSTTPVLATELTGSIALAAGRSHTCGLQADGSVRCVGADHAGQLGRGGALQAPAPLRSKLTCP